MPIEFAERIRRIPVYPAADGYALPGDVALLASNETPFAPMPAVLDAAFPAVAAREMGLSAVPLLCAREIPVPGALPKAIRVLIHAYAPDGHAPQHVYLGEARRLRLDLEGAQ